ncbi:MAG TPA: HU family DNA-binding protein [Candidatus Faeciplasma pullistercoris]|uniref:HU family DNA-binding protein n=1 Tax=Candidatus Faeciplasma pullistercoris TaxID=2840800 RepID=A0A9D1GUA9_9FIRM|nr:HU family DNA-binding protein [Candidatus Faeciplasma pullistercoris]
MTKVELVSKVAEKCDCTKKDAEKYVNAVIDSITETLAAGEKVSIIGFGVFEVKARAAKEGINPRTGDKISIDARKVPVFKAGKGLKDAVDN